jgi:micrococcal nuclease
MNTEMPDALLKQAVSAIRAGDKFNGKQYLIELIKVDPENEAAWLWMSQVVRTSEQRRQCLEKVLQINPENEVALRGLSILTEREIEPEDVEPDASELPLNSEEVPASTVAAETLPAASAEVDQKQNYSDQIGMFWDTPAGKAAIFGGGTVLGLLVICFLFVVCYLLLGLGKSEPSSEPLLPTGESEAEISDPTPIPDLFLTPDLSPTPAPSTDTPEPTPTSTVVVPATGTPTPTPERAAKIQATDLPPERLEAQVINVVDGDTIDVRINGDEFRVRYLLIEAPEIGVADELLALEATEANRQLVAGKIVILERDVSETDQDGRLLRYVWVEDLLVNEELLRIGLAQIATFSPDVRYFDRLADVQQQAQAAGVGKWASN